MNCASCPAPCCRNVLYLTPREFEQLRKKKPALKYTRIGDVTILTPCPFLVENRCAIYADRPLACVRYPLNVQYREKSVVIVLHFKCPPVPKLAGGDQMLAPVELERMGISQGEYRKMFVTNLILDAEIGRVWKNFTLKERNKMRIFEAKTKQPNPGADAVIAVMPLETYADLVQTVEDLLDADPGAPYESIAQKVQRKLLFEQ